MVLRCAGVIAIGDAARNVPTIRAAVPSRPFAQPSHPHHVIRLRANWAAVRPSVQAHPSRHSGLRAGILGGLCVVLCCAGVIAIGDAARNVPTIRACRLPRPRVGARGDGALRRCTIALSAQPPVLSSSVIPASEPESWVACAWCCAVPVSSLSETLHATSLPSAPAASQDPVSAHCAAVPRMETP